MDIIKILQGHGVSTRRFIGLTPFPFFKKRAGTLFKIGVEGYAAGIAEANKKSLQA
ncbi:hypothetical protein [Oscillibacter sp.]|uniref:hypothetical protein n=1 Tax=Oscillibacter sp. TaxID=1945593 RepID=UPI002898DFB1|nr:hypothetical protein [Oscillibacter sp.]